MVKVATPSSLIDNWNFALFGQSNDKNIPKFQGYVSSIDPTTAGTGVLIGGSQNTYKSILGTVKNRAGLKRRGPADDTDAGVISSTEWENSLGFTRVLRAVNGNLQVEFDDGTGTLQYIDLLTGLTDNEMLFSFAPFFYTIVSQDILVFVNRTDTLYAWSGAMGQIASTENAASNTFLLFKGNSSSLATFGAASGTAPFVSKVNGSLGTALIFYANFSANPSNNQTLILNINGTQQTVTFVTVIGATAGNVLIGATVTDTVNNLIGLINAPGSTTATQVAFTGTDLTNIGYITASVAGGSITMTEDVASLGFAVAASTLNIAGVNYAYTTKLGATFFGVTPDPSALAAGTVVAEVVVANIETAANDLYQEAFGTGFTLDWVNVIGNQVYLGCYTSRNVQISSIADYNNYGPFSATARAPGDPDELTLDSNSRGATSKTGQKGNAVVFGSLGDSYSIVRGQANFILPHVTNIAGSSATVPAGTATTVATTQTFVYETVIVDKSTSSDLSSPQGQDFIDSIGDTIIFLDDNNQLREFGTLRNLATPVYPILSLDVYTELAALDFTGGAIRAVAEQSGETVYLVCPISGLTYVYQIREKVDEIGNLGSERLWQPPQVWDISRIAVISGISYGYSASNPQMYQLWDTGQYYDDSPDGTSQLPYESHAIWAYQSLGNRVSQLYFDKVYFEGYMTRGTPLYCNVYKDYQGAKGIELLIVNNPETPPAVKRARFYGADGSPDMGSRSLGQIPLGQGVGGVATDFPKFRAIRNATAVGIFEYALDAFSVDVDAQWEMLVLGANMLPTPGRSPNLLLTNLVV